MIDNTMVDVRSYIFDLRPSALTGRNLDQGLRLLAEDFEKATSIPCSVDIDAGALAGLEGAAPQLIQIAREALSNVARHARPKHCWLALRREGNDSILEIRDDGRGFKSAQLTAGSGLKNMSGRAAEIGASVEFISPISPSPSAGGQGGGAIVRAHWLLSRTTTSAEPQPGAKLER
jgi:signal transduction histidine kinase